MALPLGDPLLQLRRIFDTVPGGKMVRAIGKVEGPSSTVRPQFFGPVPEIFSEHQQIAGLGVHLLVPWDLFPWNLHGRCGPISLEVGLSHGHIMRGCGPVRMNDRVREGGAQLVSAFEDDQRPVLRSAIRQIDDGLDMEGLRTRWRHAVLGNGSCVEGKTDPPPSRDAVCFGEADWPWHEGFDPTENLGMIDELNEEIAAFNNVHNAVLVDDRGPMGDALWWKLLLFDVFELTELVVECAYHVQLESFLDQNVALEIEVIYFLDSQHRILSSFCCRP